MEEAPWTEGWMDGWMIGIGREGGGMESRVNWKGCGGEEWEMDGDGEVGLAVMGKR